MPIKAFVDAKISSDHPTFNVSKEINIKISIALCDGKQSVYVNTYDDALAIAMIESKQGDLIEVEGSVNFITASSLVRNGVEYKQVGTKYPTKLALLQYIHKNFPDTDLVQADCTKEAMKKTIQEIAAK
ncbi:hypothetical protein MBANPS3_012161 [Mucor bainieri]